MSITLADIERDERTCVVTQDEETAEVVYRPSAYTPAIEDALQTAIETNRPASGVARLLSGLLISWDVLGEDGAPLATTPESLRDIPSAFLFKVINAITADMGAGDGRKNSGGGSSRKK